MAKIYYRWIKAKRMWDGHVMTIADVPEHWKTEVQELLDKDPDNAG
jgi:hypothetical protein